jgi:uncharacterized repeat protein (TIGR01451 family)
MSCQINVHSLSKKVISVLIAAAAIYGLVSQVLPGLQLEAYHTDLTSLTFRSPVGNPELRVNKTVDDDAPRPGDVIEYTLAYSTTHPGSRAFNVALYDFLPDGVAFVSSSPPGFHSDGVVVFTADSVSAETQSVRVRAEVLPGYRELRNRALVTADFVGPTYDSLSTSVTDYPVELRLDKWGTSAALVGGELVYELRVENDSGYPVDYLTVVDVLPAGVTFAAASPPPDERDPFLRWSLEELPPHESFEAVITGTAPSATGVITNAALASGVQTTLSQETFAAEIVDTGAILRVRKDGSAPAIEAGDELEYTLRYENAGNVAAGEVVLTDTLPAGVTVRGTSSDPDVETSGYLVWDLGSLAPTDPAGTITVTVAVTGGGRWLHNVVDIAGEPGTFSGHDEDWTWVRPVTLYLPIVLRY